MEGQTHYSSEIGIFTCVCERDKKWIPQLQAEAARLGWPISWYADNLSEATLLQLRFHPSTVNIHIGAEKFSERSKQHAFNYLKANGYKWAVGMDVDETLERDVRPTFDPEAHIGRCPMVQVDENDGKLYRRTEGPFSPTGIESSRFRVYNLAHEWRWLDPFTNGAYLWDTKTNDPATAWQSFDAGFTTVHWGYATADLRMEHGKKWDEVYMQFGRNPYKTYEYLNDPDTVPGWAPLEAKYYKHLPKWS